MKNKLIELIAMQMAKPISPELLRAVGLEEEAKASEKWYKEAIKKLTKETK